MGGEVTANTAVTVAYLLSSSLSGDTADRALTLAYLFSSDGPSVTSGVALLRLPLPSSFRYSRAASIFVTELGMTGGLGKL